ncbi:MAG: chromosomal protein MC1 [Candidatus Methanoperedens sp.]|nr:chromosomal protein MC1 [Candidatus Methanoperedens sp.]
MAKRTKTKTKKTSKKNYVLRGKNGKETGVFSGNQPRQAALKVANRSKGTKSSPVEIRLRERGSKKIHIFKGWKETVAAPKNKPAWMPDKINKPNVEKVGIEKLKKI